MDARALTRPLAFGRIALGAGLVAAPQLFTALWLGKVPRGGHVLAAGLGARDLAIGIGTARALAGGGSLRPWLVAGAIGDAADLIATLRARDDLPTLGVVGVGAFAAAGTALSLYAASQSAP